MNQGLAIVFPLIIFSLLDIAAIINMFTYRDSTKLYKAFKVYAISVTFMQCITAVAYGCTYGVFRLSIPICYLVQCCSFISMVTAGFFWYRYISYTVLGEDCPRLYNVVAFIPYVAISVEVLISPVTKWVFYLDENGNYNKGPGYYVHAFICWFFLICALIVTIHSFVKNKKLDRNIIKILLFFIVPNIVGTYFQLSFFRGGYSQMGNSVGFMLLYLEQFIESFNENKRLRGIDQLNKRLAQRMNIIESMSQVYFVSFYIDVKDNTFIELSSSEIVHNISSSMNDVRAVVKMVCEKAVLPEYRQEMLDFFDLSTVSERLNGKNWITHDYKGIFSGWSQAYIIAGDRDEDGNLNHVFFNGRTIHEEKAREESQNEKLAMALMEAASANEAKTNFLFNMSHDIRTPMNAVLGYMNLIEKNIDSPTIIREYLEKMKASGEYLLTLINNILELAKIDSGNEVVDEGYVDLYDRNCSVVPLLENEIKRKGLNYSNEMNIEHRYVMADMAKIKEITMNLMSNAIKYTPEGGHIHMQFDEVYCDREGYARYVNSISDSGVGMSEEYRKKVFDSFSRERNTTESKVEGTGLGMAIVKKLVDLMGGSVTVESELGVGTTFRVTLEHRIIDSPDKFIENRDDKEGATIQFEGKRVLLAEDNDINAEIAGVILEDLGFKVDRAVDGIECMDMLYRSEDGYYDLILMDIQMPRMNGYKATTRIRDFKDDRKANIPIIAMTANAFEEDRQNAFKAGMNGHISKPLEIPVIIKEINRVLCTKE